jgi:alpha-glucan, water dikinase
VGVVAVLTSSATDVLSHIAIRARSQGVLLATCFDAAQLEAIKALDGKHVEVGVTSAGDVLAAVAQAPASAGAKAGAGGKAALVRLAKVGVTKKWVLMENEFEEGLVGGKSRNLATLRGKLPDW